MNWRLIGLSLLKFLAFAALVIGCNIAMMFLIVPISSAMHWSDAWLNQLAPAQMILGELTIGIPAIIATGVMAFIEKRSILSYGFTPSPIAGRRFLEGI